MHAASNAYIHPCQGWMAVRAACWPLRPIPASAKKRPSGFFSRHGLIFICLWAVREVLKVILSHMAPSCLNMSSYRAIWTHFKSNACIFSRFFRSANPRFSKLPISSSTVASLMHTWHTHTHSSRDCKSSVLKNPIWAKVTETFDLLCPKAFETLSERLSFRKNEWSRNVETPRKHYHLHNMKHPVWDFGYLGQARHPILSRHLGGGGAVTRWHVGLAKIPKIPNDVLHMWQLRLMDVSVFSEHVFN